MAAAPGGGAPAPGVLTVDLVPLVPQILELGATLNNPTFNLLEAGGGALTSRTVQDNDGNPAQNALGQSNPFTMPFPYVKTGVGNTVVFTYQADDGGGVKQDQETFTWLPRVYAGVAAAGTVNEAFIEALAESELRADRGIDRNGLVWTAGQFVWVAFPQAFNPTTGLEFLLKIGGAGFPGGFVLDTAGVSVTPNTPGGVALLYDVWRSTGSGTGLTVDLQVSP